MYVHFRNVYIIIIIIIIIITSTTAATTTYCNWAFTRWQ